MQDFIWKVRGASDALLDFRNNLSGNTSNNRVSSSNSNNASHKTDDLLTVLRRAIISQESGAKTINFKLNEYLPRGLQATGNDLDLARRKVASTWYGGNPDLYNNTRPQQ